VSPIEEEQEPIRKELQTVLPYTPPSSQYTFLEDAYTGGGGFKDGSYLMPHPRETPDKYIARKQMAYYLNYVKVVVNSLTEPIFRKPAVRDWGNRKQDTDLFSMFMLDVDGNNTSIEKFMKRVAHIAQLNAVAFIVVDNEPEQPATRAQAIKTRSFPYMFVIKPQQVTEWKVDKRGRITKFVYEVYSSSSSGGAIDEKETWTWTPTEWSVRVGDSVTQSSHSLKQVPVVPVFASEEDPNNLLPESEIYQIAKANLAIFNICSELREVLRNQAFSILTYPITGKIGAEEALELVVGTENVLPFDGESKSPPSFISPPVDPVTQLQAELKRLIEEIYRQASLLSVTGVQVQSSGVAKAWDFDQTNQVLSDLANSCEHAEVKVAKLFELWTNDTVDFVCNYPDDFGIVDIIAKLDEVTKALDLNIGGKFNIEVKRKAAEVVLGDLPEERFDAVIEDIELMGNEQIQ
jgi:hypothetical protein